MRASFFIGLLLLGCGTPVQPVANCTTVLCPIGDRCNLTTGRCESTGGFGGGSSSTGGGASAGGAAAGGAAAGGAAAGGASAGGSAGGAAGVDGGVSGWRVTVDASRLSTALPATCYVNGQVPGTIPPGPGSFGFEVLLVDGRFPHLVLGPGNRLAELKLGAAPAPFVPEAIEGEADGGARTFDAAAQTIGLGPAPKSALETRSRQLLFSFDTAASTGSLRVTASYSCADLGAERCPTGAEARAGDAASCTLEFPLTLQRLAALPSWARPNFSGRSGLILIGQSQNPGSICYRDNRVPYPQTSTRNVRTFTLGEVEPVSGGSRLHLPSRVVKLGDSPSFVLETMRATGPSMTFTHEYRLSSIGPASLGKMADETRTATARLDLSVADVTLELRSNYACADLGTAANQRCPVGNEPKAPDAFDCAVTVPQLVQPVP